MRSNSVGSRVCVRRHRVHTRSSWLGSCHSCGRAEDCCGCAKRLAISSGSHSPESTSVGAGCPTPVFEVLDDVQVLDVDVRYCCEMCVRVSTICANEGRHDGSVAQHSDVAEACVLCCVNDKCGGKQRYRRHTSDQCSELWWTRGWNRWS
jgi:hypothetical protein